MSVINTNYLALVSQNNLNRSQSALGTAIERLSSGLRINSAKDDAAGQAIANRFTANIRGLTQAARNANDGISIAQTTEGALNEINNNLQRIRELTVDAANGTKSGSDLKSIQNEIKERLDEINRVSEQTQFNGVRVLGEDAAALSVQVGANDGQRIDIELSKINQNTLKLDGFDVTKAYAKGMTPITEVNDTADAADIATALNAVEITTGETVATVDEIRKSGDDYYVRVSNADDDAHGYAKLSIDESGNIGVAGSVTTNAPAGWNAADTVTEVVTGQTEISTTAAQTAATAAGSLLGNSAKIDNIYQDEGGTYYAQVSGTTDGTYDGFHEVNIDATGVVSFAAADLTTAATVDAEFSAEIEGMNAPTGVNIKPLDALDQALQKVDDLRSHLGAIQNRFESTIANLNNTVNNLSAARSRIEDADYAVEVSNMTRAQILQQAGTSVLAQANQVPQTVLSLLR
ncbi:FliC/FljB family flagellin [Pusillimonas noertemannii]|uniref:Flagellin n=1 Tax=Pusillimonas noertemannii TaxID=305977 RepID=A0A2U1CIY0_9BURK|nr:FliC/FljB family flagellin [Pusillimonas noertemannii]NYT69993.1 FliC/FljB family flagellin [Pusillimonas noertemannii]PVY60944.1 flagellin [Pusillimonas noertemannii]TFL08398.1 FliC/FljB family flagellin [Pusillimonas noertemannii]